MKHHLPTQKRGVNAGRRSGSRNVPSQMSFAKLVILRYTEVRQLIRNDDLLICFAYPPVYQRIRPLDDWYIFDWLPPQDSNLYLPESLGAGRGRTGRDRY